MKTIVDIPDDKFDDMSLLLADIFCVNSFGFKVQCTNRCDLCWRDALKSAEVKTEKVVHPAIKGVYNRYKPAFEGKPIFFKNIRPGKKTMLKLWKAIKKEVEE